MDLRKDEDRAALADEFGPIEVEPPDEYGVDRTGWPAGVWDGEPDEIRWECEGLACVMVRHPQWGHWSGQVGVAEGHRFYRVPAEAVEVAVHGGLDLAYFSQGLWWLGFNCNHGYDFCPGFAPKLYKILARQYKTVEFVRAECAKLAGQLK